MSSFFEKWASESAERQKLLFEEELILDVTETIWEDMERLNINKVELAERLGKSKAHMSQLLNGSRNMTLRSLADICFALEVQPKFTFEHPVAAGNNGEWSYSSKLLGGNVVRMKDYIAHSQEIDVPVLESDDGWMRAAK